MPITYAWLVLQAEAKNNILPVHIKFIFKYTHTQLGEPPATNNKTKIVGTPHQAIHKYTRLKITHNNTYIKHLGQHLGGNR